jgi:hypothetical protein
MPTIRHSLFNKIQTISVLNEDGLRPARRPTSHIVGGGWNFGAAFKFQAFHVLSQQDIA